jgi:hypothetical protein
MVDSDQTPGIVVGESLVAGVKDRSAGEPHQHHEQHIQRAPQISKTSQPISPRRRLGAACCESTHVHSLVTGTRSMALVSLALFFFRRHRAEPDSSSAPAHRSAPMLCATEKASDLRYKLSTFISARFAQKCSYQLH